MEFLAVSCLVFKTLDSANADPAKTANDSVKTKTVQAIFFKLLTSLKGYYTTAWVAQVLLIQLNIEDHRRMKSTILRQRGN